MYWNREDIKVIKLLKNARTQNSGGKDLCTFLNFDINNFLMCGSGCLSKCSISMMYQRLILVLCVSICQSKLVMSVKVTNMLRNRRLTSYELNPCPSWLTKVRRSCILAEYLRKQFHGWGVHIFPSRGSQDVLFRLLSILIFDYSPGFLLNTLNTCQCIHSIPQQSLTGTLY